MSIGDKYKMYDQKGGEYEVGPDVTDLWVRIVRDTWWQRLCRAVRNFLQRKRTVTVYFGPDDWVTMDGDALKDVVLQPWIKVGAGDMLFVDSEGHIRKIEEK